MQVVSDVCEGGGAIKYYEARRNRGEGVEVSTKAKMDGCDERPTTDGDEKESTGGR